MEIIRSLEGSALALRDRTPEGAVTKLMQASADIELPMERPLFSPPLRPRVDGRVVADANEDIAADALFEQWVVDKDELRARIRQALAERDQIRLCELVEAHPLERGLTELMAYLSLASEDRNAVFSEEDLDRLAWSDREGKRRGAELPRVVFTKEHRPHAEP